MYGDIFSDSFHLSNGVFGLHFLEFAICVHTLESVHVISISFTEVDKKDTTCPLPFYCLCFHTLSKQQV